MSPSGGNRNDSTQLVPLPGKVPSVAGLAGGLRKRRDTRCVDCGYGHDTYPVRERGIRPVIAPRGVPQGSGLPVHRWMPGQAAWPNPSGPGSRLWKFRTGDTVTSPAVAANVVYAGSEDGYLYAVRT
ncbi:PQQ-binding-like beta-propeller repeat protein [Streptomyces sp. NBC_00510]